MNTPLRLVPTTEAQEVSLGEATGSFEEFFRVEHTGLFRAL